MSKKRKKKNKKLNKRKEKYAKFSKVDDNSPKLESPKIDREQRDEAERSLRDAMRYYRPLLDKQEKVRMK